MAAPALAADLQIRDRPKAMNNPFSTSSRDGCMKRAKELGNVECIYKGPVEHEPATPGRRSSRTSITQKVDGIAISVADVAADDQVDRSRARAGIPVITFDADAPGSARQAPISARTTRTSAVALGKELMKLRPDGGKYAMVSGGPGADNLPSASTACATRSRDRSGPRSRARRPSATTIPRWRSSRCRI